ncbi:MAG TPA: FkbM family methyltransferase [Candidatus Limnocylindria bacterium]|nr:FkbM family methyltransferase [Candidatus Limnocylindria bacterium]
MHNLYLQNLPESKKWRPISDLKSLFVTCQPRPRRILTGPFRGIVMNLSMKTQSQMYLGLWERETYSWLRSLSAGIATAIDIGAAFGEYTLFFLKKTPAVRVYAFEPDKAFLPSLYENLKLNDLHGTDRLMLCTKFVGTCDNDRECTLDSLGESLQYPCLIKIDVDGAEEAILRGAKDLAGLRQVRWLIETHSKELEGSCARILTEVGFQVKLIPNAWWRVVLPEDRRTEHNRWLAALKGD